MITREQSRDTLAALKPAAIFLDAYGPLPLPENLDIYFRPPEEFFLAPETLAAYTEGRLIPILDDGNFDLVTFYDPVDCRLIQKDVETPHEVRASFANWQQFLADLMIRIAESMDDDARVLRIARLVGFRYFDELMQFVSGGRKETSQEYEIRKARFIESIRDRQL